MFDRGFGVSVTPGKREKADCPHPTGVGFPDCRVTSGAERKRVAHVAAWVTRQPPVSQGDAKQTRPIATSRRARAKGEVPPDASAYAVGNNGEVPPTKAAALTATTPGGTKAVPP